MSEPSRESPWNNGGKQEFYAASKIAMSHDELAERMGSAHRLMLDSGFVMVPRKWRDDVMNALSRKPEEAVR